MRGDMAMVEEGTPGTKKVCSVAPPPIRPIPPTDCLDVLRGWGQTWIWDDLMVTGGTDWIAQAIADNSLVAVTDGSYIKEHYPELCSTAFVLVSHSVPMPALGHPTDHYGQLCQPILPSGVPSCGGAPGRSHSVGGSDPSRPTQFGM